MEYPQDFPKHLQPPVDAAIAKAEIEFIKAKKHLPFSRCGYDQAVDKLIEKYVEKVFFAFAQQARKAGADGTWSEERIRYEVDEFLRKLIIHAYYEKNTYQSVDIAELFEGDVTRRIKRRVKESVKWLEHQKELTAAAKAQAAPDPVCRPTPKNLESRRSEGPAPIQAVGIANGGNGNGADQVSEERVALLRTYKTEGAKRAILITDKMIAEAANPGRWNDRTPVQRWKRNYKCTSGDDARIRAVLKNKPHLR